MFYLQPGAAGPAALRGSRRPFFTGRPGANGSGRNAATANAPWNHIEPNILIGHIQYESTVKPYVTCLKPFSL